MPPSGTEGERPRRPAAIVARSALVVAVAWLAALAVLAIRTSNPVTLNRQQVLRALRHGVVVRARVIEVSTGECEALEQWPTRSIADSFHVSNLRHTGARIGDSYLLPLIATDDGHVVVPSPAGRPLIYPDSEQALAQLDELLLEHGGGLETPVETTASDQNQEAAGPASTN